MFEQREYSASLEKNYQLLIKQLEALIEDEPDPIANLSNSAALLNQFLERINWVGFYLLKQDQLVLGPFQGLPACVRIEIGKGVCGTAVATEQTQLVADVHQFPGHIACDARSQSEIVIPLFKKNRVIGVLDIDSPEKNRFSQMDQNYLEQFCQVLMKYIPESN
ncbi:MAG TPA: GAF domain-containing protein [Bacilli bacterium]|nr:GAF domain-containing protein [Bacilli bacterium]